MADVIPVHQWTNGGSEVLILRCCDANGKSHGGRERRGISDRNGPAFALPRNPVTTAAPLLAWRNTTHNRSEMRAALIGCGDGSDGKLKADTWYRLNVAGEFEEG